jgi:hypothetical protein
VGAMVSWAVEGKYCWGTMAPTVWGFGGGVDLTSVDLPMVSGSILPADLGAGEFCRSGRRRRDWGFG